MPVNILVADDSVTVRRMMELTFAGEDARVTSVDSGDAAISKAAGLAPDVVFADLSMSTDGYQVAAAIKSAPGMERTAVILLASQKHPYDEAKGRAAGVDDHVVKPFDTQHVLDKLKSVMGQPRAAAPKAAAAQAAMPAAATAGRPSRTIAFERAPMAAPPPQQPPARAPSQVASPPSTSSYARGAAASATASGGDMAAKLDGLGLSAAQVDGVLKLSREVIERVVWEVVPDLAETIIREEIKRLTS